MPGAGRLGDKANIPADAHGCPGCPHPGTGPAVSGSGNVNINGRPALRVGDAGYHAACCGPNTWQAMQGAPSVFINGKAAYRLGDPSRHCGGIGKLIEGSGDVIVGNATGGGGSGGGGSSSGGGGSASGASGSGGGGASGASGGAAPGAASSTGGAAAPAQNPTPPAHWTEFRFRDAGGRALAGARYRIVLPDGSKVRGSLDAQGRARHEQLPEGSSHLELVDIDAARWSASESDAHDPITLSVETSGLDAGETVKIEIFRLYRERAGQAVTTLQVQVDGNGHAEATWRPSSVEAPDDQFLFKASVGRTFRKSAPLTVRRRATSADWSVTETIAGSPVSLRADLRGVRDGEAATIRIFEKQWRRARDSDVQQLRATVSGGAVQAEWTPPAPAAPLARGDTGRREFYFTVEAAGLHRTSGLLAVLPRPRIDA